MCATLSKKWQGVDCKQIRNKIIIDKGIDLY